MHSGQAARREAGKLTSAGIPRKLLDHALGPENYHPIEYQIFCLSLRRNAQTRVAAYLAARTGVN
jgi:hypothetical protein